MSDRLFTEVWQTNVEPDREAISVILGDENEKPGIVRLTLTCADTLTSSLTTVLPALLEADTPRQALLVDDLKFEMSDDGTAILRLDLRSGAQLRLAVDRAVARAAALSYAALSADTDRSAN